MPISARTDIVPLGRNAALFLLTTTKTNGEEGGAFAARTLDGGQSFEFMGFVGEEPKGYRIMPSSIRMDDGPVVTTTRCADREGSGWIGVFRSTDEGHTWNEIGLAVPDTGNGGNPPALAFMPDTRLSLAYGVRVEPYGIRMRMSDDGGVSWTEEMIIRADGGTPDLGYPKSVILGDGTLLVMFNFNEGAGRERYIAGARIRHT